MNPLVSIIIPAFNTEFVVGEAITSCLNQSLRGGGQNIEIVLVDDGSNDGTLEVAQSFATLDSRVRVVAMPQNVGTFAARIAGVLESRGEFVLFLDSDDVLLPHCVQSFLDAASSAKGVDIVFADRITHSADSQKITRNFAHLKAPCVLNQTQIFAEVFAIKTWQSSRWTQTGKLYTRDVLVCAIDFVAQTFGEIPRGVAGFEDGLFSFAILQFAQTALVIDEVLYEYLWRGRAEKMRNLKPCVPDSMRVSMYEARVIGLLETLASAQIVRESELCAPSAVLLRHLKYDYYAGMRHKTEFVALDSSSKPSLLPIYLRAVAHSFWYGKRGRAFVRMLLFVISLGRIKR